MPRTSNEAIARGKLKQKLTYRRKKKELVDMFGDKCAMCKSTFPPCCYDFHHLDPSTKEAKVSQLVHLSSDKLEVEVKKCIMVCANCHRIIHSYKDKGEVNAS
jgi:predicted HNH restriction endonuclease